MDSSDSLHIGQLQQATLERLKKWKGEGQVLVKAAQTLGVEEGQLAEFSGTLTAGGTPVSIRRSGGATARTRTRSRSRARSTSNGNDPPGPWGGALNLSA